MSDQNSSGPQGAGGTQGAQDQQQGQQEPPIVIHGQYVKDLSFESPHAPGILANMGQAPQLDIQLNVNARPVQKEQQKRLFEVMLKLRATAKQQDRTAFVIELDYGALVSLGSVVPEERIEAVLLIDVATLIFPFARRMVAEISREGGFPPVLINPVDFVSLYRQRKAQEQAKAQPAGNA